MAVAGLCSLPISFHSGPRCRPTPVEGWRAVVRPLPTAAAPAPCGLLARRTFPAPAGRAGQPRQVLAMARTDRIGDLHEIRSVPCGSLQFAVLGVHPWWQESVWGACHCDRSSSPVPAALAGTPDCEPSLRDRSQPTRKHPDASQALLHPRNHRSSPAHSKPPSVIWTHADPQPDVRKSPSGRNDSCLIGYRENRLAIVWLFDSGFFASVNKIKDLIDSPIVCSDNEPGDFPRRGERRRVGGLSCERIVSGHGPWMPGPFSGPFSLVPKSRFPETETAVAETGSIVTLLSGESEHLALA